MGIEWREASPKSVGMAGGEQMGKRTSGVFWVGGPQSRWQRQGLRVSLFRMPARWKAGEGWRAGRAMWEAGSVLAVAGLCAWGVVNASPTTPQQREKESNNDAMRCYAESD